MSFVTKNTFVKSGKDILRDAAEIRFEIVEENN